MPADDRDTKFERALAHHLRGDSAAACPDEEMLAAYHERSLSFEEMAHWKQHISGCAACQETLALVETTEKQLAEDWEKKGIPVLQASAQRPSAARLFARRSKEAPSEEEALAEGVSPAAAVTVEISHRRRPPLLRWAVPLGAVAAGVLVWIGIHEQGALKRQAESFQMSRNQSPSTPVQMAQTEPAPTPEQKMNDALQSAPPMERHDRQGRLAEQVAGKRAEDTETESRRASPSLRMAKPAPGAKDEEFAKKETDGRISDALAYKTAPSPPSTPAHAQTTPKAPASTTESVEVSAAAPTVDTGSFQAGAGVGVGGAAGAVSGGPAREIDSKSASNAARQKAPAKQQAQAGNDLDAATSAMMMKQGINGRDVNSLSALVPGPAVILTPDNRVWWKVEPAGTLELTTDGGKTWKPLRTVANAQLTAGSAPSSRVCWIAGKAGTLVLTTDRGAHWRALTTPITGDLGGVRATDANHASIWDSTHQQSFETSDGGVTWKQTSP